MLLITGANGQLGRSFRHLAAEFPAFEFVFTDSLKLDISNRTAVFNFFEKHRPAFCINCAAYTAVDKAESEPAAAYAANHLGVKHLAEACAEAGIPLVHFSSDYVYHTAQGRPYVETDATRPKSVYARSKRAGEQAALRAHPLLSMVVRTSWVYAPWGHNFVHTMLRLGSERPELRVVFDQIGAPTYAPDLARMVLNLLLRVKAGTIQPAQLAGIWNYANEGVCSWYDFAQAIFEMKKMKVQVLPIRSAEYPTPALRPFYSVLDKAKIKAAFGLEIPHWRTSLARCLEAIL